MIDIGPRLDSRLRDKFTRIDAQAPPQRLLDFQAPASRRRHRSLNVIAGVAAVAVVAAGAVVFAIELGSHPHPTPAPQPAQGGQLPHMPVYSTPPPFNSNPITPLYGTGFARSWYVAVPLTTHTGSATLPAFIPAGWTEIQYACIGTGQLTLETPDGSVHETLKPCSSSSSPVDAQISGESGPLFRSPVALQVVTSPSVRWEIIVADTAQQTEKLPTLPPLPADAVVLVPLTYGEGIAALPSFKPRGYVEMQWWCSGPGGIQVFVSNGNESQGASHCGVSGSGGTDDYAGTRETLIVDVSPACQWEIRIFWEPNNSSG
jgi:hypothetical protein